MAIMIYAQLDQSTFLAARLTSEYTGRWQYGRYIGGASWILFLEFTEHPKHGA